eukprot:scaffold2979_cov243-Pinguiococcus_pyrenoidosus.AAC.3
MALIPLLGFDDRFGHDGQGDVGRRVSLGLPVLHIRWTEVPNALGTAHRAFVLRRDPLGRLLLHLVDDEVLREKFHKVRSQQDVQARIPSMIGVPVHAAMDRPRKVDMNEPRD